VGRMEQFVKERIELCLASLVLSNRDRSTFEVANAVSRSRQAIEDQPEISTANSDSHAVRTFQSLLIR
jgi:hypothetical protein